MSASGKPFEARAVACRSGQFASTPTQTREFSKMWLRPPNTNLRAPGPDLFLLPS